MCIFIIIIIFRCQRSPVGYWRVWQPTVTDRRSWEIWSKNTGMELPSCEYWKREFVSLLSEWIYLQPTDVSQTEHCTEAALRCHRVSPRSGLRDRRLRRALAAQLRGVPGLHRGRGRGLVHRRHHECTPGPRRGHDTRRWGSSGWSVLPLNGFFSRGKTTTSQILSFRPCDRHDLCCWRFRWKPASYQHGALWPKHRPVEHAGRYADSERRSWSGGGQWTYILFRYGEESCYH